MKGMPPQIRAARHQRPDTKRRICKAKFIALGLTTEIVQAAADGETVAESAQVLNIKQNTAYDTKRKKCFEIFAAWRITAQWMKAHVPDAAATHDLCDTPRQIFQAAMRDCD